MIRYLGSLAVMLVAAFWSVDALSGEISRTFSLDNFKTLIDDPVYRDVAQRTILIAAARHPHRRAARVPDRLLHGEGRQPADEGGAAWWRS